MQDANSEAIELQDIEAPVIETLVAAMYGHIEEYPPNLLLPLFVAADSHQVLILLILETMSSLRLLAFSCMEASAHSLVAYARSGVYAMQHSMKLLYQT